MKRNGRHFSRFLSLFLVLALILASLPSLAEDLSPATPTDLGPAEQEDSGEGQGETGGDPEENPEIPETPENPSGEEPEKTDTETPAGEQAADPEAAAPAGPAFLNAGTEIFADEDLLKKQGTLAEKAVVFLLSSGDRAASVCYAVQDEEGQAVKASGFVAATVPRLLTEEELKDWSAQPHPDALQAQGIFLDPVVFVPAEKGEETKEPPVPAEKKEEETEQAPAPADEKEGETRKVSVPAEVKEEVTEKVPAPAEVKEEGTEKSPALAEVKEEGTEKAPAPADAEEEKTGEPPVLTVSADPDEEEETGDLTDDSEAAAATSTDLMGTGEPADEEIPLNTFGHIESPEETVIVVEPKPENVPEAGQEETVALSATGDGVIFSMQNGEVVANYESHYENENLPDSRNQGVWGTCWAFAAIGALEIDLIAGGMADKSVIDLSELYLLYFAAHNYPYAKGGGDGDDISAVGSGTYLDFGGNTAIAYRILANLIGTVAEADAPYNTSKEPDLPTKYSSVAAQITGAYLIDTYDRDAVKQAILDHGAVGASINSKHTYNPTEECMYGTGSATDTDHDILLVGWDDTFSRTRFTTPPPGDGAWKVRNSWSKEASGGLPYYFWISYEDGAFKRTDPDKAVYMTAYDATADVSDFCYSFDKTPYPGGYYSAEDKAVVRQTFTVDGNEKLQAVGVETGSDNTKITVSVRIGGKEVARGSVTAVYRGFYLVSLNSPYDVATRTDVELFVTYQATELGARVAVPYEKIGQQDLADAEGEEVLYHLTADSGSGGFWFNDEKKEGDARLKLYTKKNASSGPESVTISPSSVSGLKTGDTQKLTVSPSDASLIWYSSNTGAAIVEQDGTVIGGPRGGTSIITAIAPNGVYGTCIVSSEKTTVEVEGVQIEGFDGAKSYRIDDSTAGGMTIGSTMRIECSLTPKYPSDYTIVWASTNSSVIEVTEQVGTHCNVKLLKNGSSQIYVKVKDNTNENEYEDFVELTVYLPVHVASVALDVSSIVLSERDSLQLNATIFPDNAENKGLTWSSSNASVARVNNNGLVTGVKDGTAVITVKTLDGGYTASCSVTVQTQDLVEAFVYRMYRVCLLREPDESGFADWVNALKSGTKTGSQVAYGFYLSQEMIESGLSNGQFATRAYIGILGRDPDPAGLADWTSRLDKGVSYSYIVAGFTNSEEFTQLCAQYGIIRGNYQSSENRDQNLGITSFISRLYLVMLGRGYDVDGLNMWCGRMVEDPTRATALDIATNGFMHSEEFLNKQLSDVDFVKVLYRTFLDREFDEPGLNDWVNRLASGSTRDEVASGFANSQEFANIMEEYGIH